MGRSWHRALVTGASTGIGRAFAERLAAEGTHLVLVSRDVERLEALAAVLERAHGVDVEVLPADLDEAGPLAAVAKRLAASPDVDLLFNNAGLGFKGAFASAPLPRVDCQLNVNVVALVHLTHAALGAMRSSGRGTVVNVSSVVGEIPGPGNATYGATKAFVTGFSEALHAEAKRDGLTVTVVLPGATRTEFHQRGGFKERMPRLGWQSADAVAKAALDGARRGRAVVVPGVHNKAIVVAAKLMPQAVGRRVSAAFSDF
jgi:short-subunit dehydrogenase